MLSPPTWTQRVGGLTAVPGLLRALGADPGEVLDAVGLPPDAFDDAEHRLPYVAVIRALAECARTTGCEHFGLLAGAQWHLPDVGLVGALCRHSDRVGSALETLAVYLRLNNQGATCFFERSGEYAELGYAVFHPELTETAVACDLAIATAANLVRGMVGDPNWHPAEVLLSRAAPSDTRPYRQHFNCPVRFDADRAALRIPARELDRPLPDADLERKEHFLDEAERVLGDEFLVRIYDSLRRLLLKGAVDSHAVAATLAMHRRTLMRRLEQRGTSFQKVLDEVRFAVARQLLRETALSATEIAAALGFSESSAFTHAFRRWSGTSPSEWRRSLSAK